MQPLTCRQRSFAVMVGVLFPVGLVPALAKEPDAGLALPTAAAPSAEATLLSADESVTDDAALPKPEGTRGKIVEGLKSSFAFPVRDLLIRKHETEFRDLFDGLTIAPGLQLPLSARSVGAGGTGTRTSGSSALTLDLRYMPVGYWFAQVELIAYLEPSKRAPWNGDFTYSFGYDDYHPYTLSLIYSNYAENRFDPRPGNPITRLDRGTISLGWKVPLPARIASALLFNKQLGINCRVGVNSSPRYDREDGSVGEWKGSANLGCHYPFTSLYFVDLNLFTYWHGQQPWDPDYTYSFGLADYRSGRFSVVYSNYSGNRYPGRRNTKTGAFRDGGLSLTWNRQF